MPWTKPYRVWRSRERPAASRAGFMKYPREHPELGTLSSDIEKVARALARKDRVRSQPASAYATNPGPRGSHPETESRKKAEG